MPSTTEVLEGLIMGKPVKFTFFPQVIYTSVSCAKL